MSYSKKVRCTRVGGISFSKEVRKEGGVYKDIGGISATEEPPEEGGV